jgi:hypothetical protein
MRDAGALTTEARASSRIEAPRAATAPADETPAARPPAEDRDPLDGDALLIVCHENLGPRRAIATLFAYLWLWARRLWGEFPLCAHLGDLIRDFSPYRTKGVHRVHSGQRN